MKLSIVLPTIPGREAEVARTIEIYEYRTHVPIEWIIERGHDNCGAAWNAGAPKATGEVLHMGADDIEPETDQWLPAALWAFHNGHVPLGYVREDEIGTFGRDFARVVICRREWWEPVIEQQYWSDNHFDDLMRAAGHTPEIAEGFDFYHRKSMVGRDESRMEREREAYRALREVASEHGSEAGNSASGGTGT
jgi:hypothetical protein